MVSEINFVVDFRNHFLNLKMLKNQLDKILWLKYNLKVKIFNIKNNQEENNDRKNMWNRSLHSGEDPG